MPVVLRLVRLALQELLVVVVVMELVEARGQAEVGQLDVAASIQEDIVWFDITVRLLANAGQLTIALW